MGVAVSVLVFSLSESNPLCTPCAILRLISALAMVKLIVTLFKYIPQVGAHRGGCVHACVHLCV